MAWFIVLALAAMPLVRVRLLFDKKSVAEPAKPFAAEVSAKVVLDNALSAVYGCTKRAGS